MTFCGLRAQFGDGSVIYKLADQRPKFFVESGLPGISREDLIAACLTAFGRWSEVCDVIFTPTDDRSAAQFVITTHQFDGPLGILADCELPAPNLRPQTMRIDPSEKWQIADNPAQGYLDLLAVLCHEIGHGIGLQHFDPAVPPPELMNPVYSVRIVKPQPGEIAFVQKLYGKPQLPPPAPPGPTPPTGDDAFDVDLQFSHGDVRYRAQGKAHRVA